MRRAQAGDVILLVSGRGHRSFIRTLEVGRRIETDKGYLLHDDLIGQPLGVQVRTHLGHPFYLLTPTTDELIRNLPRESQIIFPKDAGYTIMKLGIKPGSKVVEAGTGSGGFCLALATAVGADGHVYSYDTRSDFQALARRNLDRVGLAGRVTFRTRDIEEGIDETDSDAVFIDMLTPDKVLEQARVCLRGSGALGCLVPTANQVIDLLRGLSAHNGYAFVEVEEILLRSYKPVAGRLRPDDRMIGHTGYLVFARAVLKPSESFEDFNQPPVIPVEERKED